MSTTRQQPRRHAASSSGPCVYGGDGQVLARCQSGEVARRVAVCLDFCAGFTDEELLDFDGGLAECMQDCYDWHPAGVVETTPAGLCDVDELRRLAAAPDVVTDH